MPLGRIRRKLQKNKLKNFEPTRWHGKRFETVSKSVYYIDKDGTVRDDHGSFGKAKYVGSLPILPKDMPVLQENTPHREKFKYDKKHVGTVLVPYMLRHDPTPTKDKRLFVILEEGGKQHVLLTSPLAEEPK